LNGYSYEQFKLPLMEALDKNRRILREKKVAINPSNIFWSRKVELENFQLAFVSAFANQPEYKNFLGYELGKMVTICF
jgi:hypothetical protein